MKCDIDNGNNRKGPRQVTQTFQPRAHNLIFIMIISPRQVITQTFQPRAHNLIFIMQASHFSSIPLFSSFFEIFKKTPILLFFSKNPPFSSILDFTLSSKVWSHQIIHNFKPIQMIKFQKFSSTMMNYLLSILIQFKPILMIKFQNFLQPLI